jgi:hypothetical protein
MHPIFSLRRSATPELTGNSTRASRIVARGAQYIPVPHFFPIHD